MAASSDTPVGWQLLRNRYRNKGTAFTADERDRWGLNGLLPPVVESLEQQLDRVELEYRTKGTDLGRHIFLRLLQERNVVLFYSFLQRHLAELLPVVYTPTVGLACQEWSRIYRQEHGLYLSWPDRHRIGELLDNVLADHADVDVVVVTDGERILGLGDLGAGGMGIPIGKLALYSGVGGIDPARSLPVLLDVGTDNEQLLSDPLYLGWRHARVRGDQYDELVDAFVDAVSDRLPGALLQWEDFAQQNARWLLDRHRDRVCSFNDDIQGTAAVTAAAVRSGLARTEVPADEARVVIVGAGSAGTGVADELVRFLTGIGGLDEETAARRCWLVDRPGLLHDELDGLHAFQARYAVPRADVPGDGSLLDVVRAVCPHVLIGVSGQPGLFTEEIVRAMASGVDRPIVLPLSNPTPRAEAIPSDVTSWTNGRALVGTGSPFPGVSQVNNISIFPGVGLGVTAVGAAAVSDAMITAASGAVAALAASLPGDQLLPPVSDSALAADVVALAVARSAVDDGLTGLDPGTGDAALRERIAATRWRPGYG